MPAKMRRCARDGSESFNGIAGSLGVRFVSRQIKGLGFNSWSVGLIGGVGMSRLNGGRGTYAATNIDRWNGVELRRQ
jgi:hypothetical protein